MTDWAPETSPDRALHTPPDRALDTPPDRALDTPPDRALVRRRRTEYETAGLDLADLAASPTEQWHLWHAEAHAAGVAEPNAMVLGTSGADGLPDGRVLLVRDVDDRGFTFFTNYDSVKSRQLVEMPAAVAVFAWLDLHRQVRVRGAVERVDPLESDAYFATRPRGSQIGAWASPQSDELIDRTDLESRVADVERRFGDGAIPRPPHWGGWRLVPSSVEFWQGRPSRLHDRLRYERSSEGAWSVCRLAP